MGKHPGLPGPAPNEELLVAEDGMRCERSAGETSGRKHGGDRPDARGPRRVRCVGCEGGEIQERIAMRPDWSRKVRTGGALLAP